MEEMLKSRFEERGTELPCPLNVPLTPSLHVLTIQESSKPWPFGFLGRLHYIGITITDEITGPSLIA